MTRVLLWTLKAQQSSAPGYVSAAFLCLSTSQPCPLLLTMQSEGAFLGPSISWHVLWPGTGRHLERMLLRILQSPFHICFCCCASLPVFIKVTCLPPLFAAGRGSCTELGREPSFGHLSFLQRVSTILCSLRHYDNFS